MHERFARGGQVQDGGRGLVAESGDGDAGEAFGGGDKMHVLGCGASFSMLKRSASRIPAVSWTVPESMCSDCFKSSERWNGFPPVEA